MNLDNFKFFLLRFIQWGLGIGDWGCSSLENLNIKNFDTTRVKNMENMFQDCSKLTSLDLSNFDTSKVNNMKGMFWRCNNLEYSMIN